ncbi:MerR family transcriptional regulator [Neobacillus piezotolerans]|uniref:MerR family transcriptional regulator n=1 Tax=Neobacillus piezotolerans TaxID=2259171 RepID=A0A3D8GNV0_9BACI|nr:MerR family transcriptional regulator [Neobacillus piezotolerans]RDU35961.1 MerR family transcriptional regulator [Neobacillus piezotolerans]
MEYTVQKLARLAGISSRTLRYYDEIGILKPARTNSSGYRIYGGAEVNKLQQILFYRELEVPLDAIKEIIDSPSFDGIAALTDHREKLLERRSRLDHLLANVDKTIEAAKGGAKMSDKEKFEGFKQKMIEENEQKYGTEIREKYGEEAVEQSYAKVKGMTEEQHREAERLAEEIMDVLSNAKATGDPAGELAQKAAGLHKKWLMHYWGSYSPEAHAGLAQMYVDDERFREYYDKGHPGTAEFLRDAIQIFTGMKK